eukprot:gb/GECH01014091.1/.p1 GENE.gb/GECH01014091.1/~~gb/GECH01014091.1/.p1  ORF type:complete len:784 (+),score=155.95 gb/GECH01014091.1/:1-2352(+)
MAKQSRKRKSNALTSSSKNNKRPTKKRKTSASSSSSNSVSRELSPQLESKLNETKESVNLLLNKLERFMENPSTRPWNHQEYVFIYSRIYNLCVEPDMPIFEAEFYQHLTHYFEDYLSKRVLPQLQCHIGELMLSEVTHMWQNYRDIFVKFCGKLFTYLDRFYVHSENKLPVKEQGIRLFKEIVFNNISKDLQDVILSLIERDRNAESVDRSLLAHAVQMFKDMCPDSERETFQNSEFIKRVEKESQEYFKKEAQQLLNTCNLVDYLRKVDVRIKDEQHRVSKLFEASIQFSLMRICSYELVNQSKDRLFQPTELESLFNDSRIGDIQIFYRLTERIHLSQPLADIFSAYITREGRSLHHSHVQTAQSQPSYNAFVKTLLRSYVPACLSFADRMTSIVVHGFDNNMAFYNAMTKGFRAFANESIVRPMTGTEISTPQLFAYYTDELVRKETDELQSKLDKVVQFLRFFTDKDYFIEEYKTQMSKRLLDPNSNNRDETSMISKLKWYYQGIGDLYKLEKMIQDKSLADQMKTDFQTWVKQQHLHLPFEFNSLVLTTVAWPITPGDPITIPAALAEAQDAFKRFYNTRYGSRVLTWIYSFNHVQIHAHFSRIKTLDVGAYQAIVLLMFNEHSSLTFNTIHEETKIDRDVLLKVMASLTQKKTKILVKQSTGSNITDHTSFSVNAAFTHPKSKIRVPLPRIVEQESNKTVEAVAGDRKYIIDATIVRVMKSRKTMLIQDLIKETITQLCDRFEPDPRLIKKQIEQLMEREYIQRNSSNNLRVDYLA